MIATTPQMSTAQIMQDRSSVVSLPKFMIIYTLAHDLKL